MKLVSHDVSRLKQATDESVVTHHAKISPTIVLISGHVSNSAKFRGNDKIPRQRANSAARLEIQRTAENCGPYWSSTGPSPWAWHRTPSSLVCHH